MPGSVSLFVISFYIDFCVLGLLFAASPPAERNRRRLENGFPLQLVHIITYCPAKNKFFFGLHTAAPATNLPFCIKMEKAEEIPRCAQLDKVLYFRHESRCAGGYRNLDAVRRYNIDIMI